MGIGARNFKKHNLNYINYNNPKAVKAISKLCKKYNLVDSWRIHNSNKKQFTWLQGISNKQSRLDFFLVTEELLSAITDNEIETK